MEHSVYIGDNLTVMRSDKFKKYIGNVSVIYIDPPYNTKTKKSYNDKSKREEWLKFMSERLTEGYKLLSDNGVIFISIDDNEYAYLKVLCDKIFGEKNCLGTLITKQSQRSNAKHINTIHEYILCYARDKKKAPDFKVKRVDTPVGKEIINSVKYHATKCIIENKTFEEALRAYRHWLSKYCKENGLSWLTNYGYITTDGVPYFATDLSTPGTPRTVDIPEIRLHLDPLPTRGWSSDAKLIELYNNNRLIFRDGRPYAIHYLDESEDNAPSILDFYSRQGNEDMKRLGLDGIFDTPKPVELLKYLLRIVGVKKGIVMDFFAGSGSFCQAVEEVNKEDGKELECVLIQIDEEITYGTEAYERCCGLGIKPTIPSVLEKRLECISSKYSLYN